jgi:hypothetical protein
MAVLILDRWPAVDGAPIGLGDASDDALWITGDLIDATGGTFLGPRI